MYCNNCGSELPDGAKFCQSCGVAVGTVPDGGAPPTPPEQPKPPTPGGGVPKHVVAIIVCAAVVVVFLVIGLTQCSGGGSPASSSSSSSSTASSNSSSSSSSSSGKSPSSSSKSSSSSSKSSSSSGKSSSSSSKSSSSSSKSGGSTTCEWEPEARQFLNVYPANHVLAGGGMDDPSPLTVEEWASRCLKYVNPASTIGERLTNDPVNLAGQIGFYDAATVVTDTKVTSSSKNSVTVQVTLKGTQSSWKNTTEYKQSYIVDFNAGGLIIDVKETSNSPKAI